MSDIGHFVRVPVEHLDAFYGYEIYLVRDTSAPEAGGTWELLIGTKKIMLTEAGAPGEPDTMVLHEVGVGVDQTRWPSFADSWITTYFPAGRYGRIRPNQGQPRGGQQATAESTVTA